MSSEFAAKAKHSKTALALHKAQLEATQTSLANIRRRHVFRLMDLPKELRRMILVMHLRDQCDLSWIWYGLPNITCAATGNEQLRQEVILVALQNNPLSAVWAIQRTMEWLSTIDFGVLQRAGMTCPRDGFGAIRTVEISGNSNTCIERLEETTRLLGQFENLRELRFLSTDATEMFDIGCEHGISGGALGARVRECNLDLSSLDLPNLRKVTVTIKLSTVDSTRDVSHIPEWKAIIQKGCQQVTRWLDEEFSARGLRVTVVIQTELD